MDDVDGHILRVLQDDARISIVKLAEMVGLSSAATRDRVQRLTRGRVILGYEAVIDTVRLSSGMLVYAEVYLECTGLSVAAKFKKAVQGRPEIVECHEVAGHFDYLLKARVTTLGAFRDLVASVVWSLPGVRDVRAYPVIEVIKYTTRIPL